MNTYTQPAQTDLCDTSAETMPTWKRALDIVSSIAALPILLPLVTIIAMITKVCSPGPVLFKQPRIGLKGKPFLCYKFRTMKMNADTAGHQAYLHQLMGSNAPMIKMDAKRDPRLIPGGWLLRATGLDELPQIINVLRGEMSLVGPRPCIPYEYEKYTSWQKLRFAAHPGLTGLWQVSGKNKTTFNEMINLDIRYANTKSLWLDLRIMLRTGPALLEQVLDTRKGRKAAPVDNTPSLVTAESHARPTAQPRLSLV